jgi:hypothetical protein
MTNAEEKIEAQAKEIVNALRVFACSSVRMGIPCVVYAIIYLLMLFLLKVIVKQPQFCSANSG